MTTPSNLDDFKLSQAVFEVRYDDAYILWDRTGKVWSELSRLFDKLKHHKVEPSETIFIADEKYQLMVALGKAYIIDLKPSSSLKLFKEKADAFIKLLTEFLDIRGFVRIGFRTIFIKTFEDKVRAAEALLLTNLLSVPTKRPLDDNARILLPHYSVTFETDSLGVRISMEARDKMIDFEGPLDIEELPSKHVEKHELVYDVDYYTLVRATIGQLNVKEWITQSYSLIKKNSNNFLGGD